MPGSSPTGSEVDDQLAACRHVQDYARALDKAAYRSERGNAPTAVLHTAAHLPIREKPPMKVRSAILAATAAGTLAAASVLVLAPMASAAAGCRVAYAVQNQWPGGFTANVTV